MFCSHIRESECLSGGKGNVVHASERSRPGTIFDLLTHTMRTGFDKWPWPRWWRTFADMNPQIVYLRRDDDPAIPAELADDALAGDALKALKSQVRGFRPVAACLTAGDVVPDGAESMAG